MGGGNLDASVHFLLFNSSKVGKIMKRKEGFTLIELLAVIVILAVIALIATPIIMGVINDAKKGAFKDSAYGIIHAAEIYYANHISASTNAGIKVFSFPDDSELSFQGERPTSGIVMVDAKGNVSLALGNGTWCAKKNRTEDKIRLDPYLIDDCKITEPTDTSCFTFADGKISNYNCDEIKDVIIPETINGVSVTAIGANAFYNKQITSVSIPEEVKTIGSMAFTNNQLTSIHLPAKLDTIEYAVFKNNQLSSVIIPEGTQFNTLIGQSAFQNNQLISVVLPENLTEIRDHAFTNNQLTSITFPSRCSRIADWAFAQNKLKTLILPSGLTHIEVYSFYRNELSSVIIPEGVTIIDSSAFSVNQLTSIVLPESLTEIRTSAFNLNQLVNVTIPAKVTRIESRTFVNNPLTKIINQTGRAFDWSWIITGSSGTPAVDGTFGGVLVEAR